MPDFNNRSHQAEMMDDFSLGDNIIYPIMDELEVINKLLGGHQVFFDAFEQIGIYDGMKISDWGCGGGDSLRVLAKWARKNRLQITFVGVDATPAAIRYARQKSTDFPEISYLKTDVLNHKPPECDVVVSSLFTHHFENNNWIKLVQRMLNCARKAVVINDLHRHWFAYYSIGALTRLFSRSEMVKHDSQVSVLRGFTKAELVHLLDTAGFKNYKIKWKWAFRYQVIIFK